MISRFPCDIREAGFTTEQAARIQALQVIVGNVAAGTAVPPWVLNGVIWVESRFVSTAVSKVGALGLMQLMPATGRQLASNIGIPYRPLDPESNVLMGASFLAGLHSAYQSHAPQGEESRLEMVRGIDPAYRDFDAWDAAFATYYAGAGGIKTVSASVVLPYVRAVRAAVQRFRELEAFCAGKPVWDAPTPKEVIAPRTSRTSRPSRMGPTPASSSAPTDGGGIGILLMLGLGAALLW